MIHLNIDGKEIKAHQGQTLLEVARENGIEIPTLCHDQRVKPYGSCGLCVVEMEGSNKLLRSCATSAEDGMVIKTSSPRVTKSRKLTLELLLSDHTGDCRPPCVKACPAQTDCQGYVGLIANGQYKEAVELIKEKLPLPASVGLICPHPCEEACRRHLVEEPIAIAALKAFVGHRELVGGNQSKPEVKSPTGNKVAIVGSGPAGLTSAYFLAREGHKVIIYDAMPEPGGMLRYGIPEYRLPKELLDQEIELIKLMGVEFITGTKIGRDISLDYLSNNFDAVFLGIGAWQSSRIGCVGEDTPGVIGGIDFLRQIAMHKPVLIGDKVAVVGGGNTAMDAARTAIRLGASQVLVLYRRTRAEMPAEDIEVQEAEEEGVEFKFLVAPQEIIGSNGRVSAIKLQKMELGEPDASGRRRPVPIPGAEEVIAIDTVIAAIGQQVNAAGLESVKLSKWGTLDADETTYMTSMEGVFAGGDAVTGPKIAIQAVAQGREAAQVIDKYLKGIDYKPCQQFTVERQVSADDYRDIPTQPRVQLRTEEPEKRRFDFSQVTEWLTEEEARKEAARCLECGCADYFDCRLIRYANEYSVEPQRIAGEKNSSLLADEHPHIIRNADKCILCGLCVRICDEVMGRGALGLVHRGFDSVVQPEFGLPLEETDCISCGQCEAICPTGALSEKNQYRKTVPLQLMETETICSLCSLGCRQLVKTSGDNIIKVIPGSESLLCYRGRFAWKDREDQRLTTPLIKREGKLQPASWKEAGEYIIRSVQALKSRYAEFSIGVAASAEYTLEEARAAALLAQQGLQADIMGSFSSAVGLYSKFQPDTLSGRVEDMAGTDVIIMAGAFKDSNIAAIKARQAAENGTRLLVISDQPGLADDKADLKIVPDDSYIKLINQVLAAVVQENLVDNNVKNLSRFQELKKSWEDEQITQSALEIAKVYASAARAIIIVDGFSLDSEVIDRLTSLAVVTGHTELARNGIIVITAGGNGLGLRQAGFTANSQQLAEWLKNESPKGLFVLGQDPLGDHLVTESWLKETKLLVITAEKLNPTAYLADVVLPGSSPFETSGTYLSSDGSINRLNRVKNSPAGKDNLTWFGALSDRW